MIYNQPQQGLAVPTTAVGGIQAPNNVSIQVPNNNFGIGFIPGPGIYSDRNHPNTGIGHHVGFQVQPGILNHAGVQVQPQVGINHAGVQVQPHVGNHAGVQVPRRIGNNAGVQGRMMPMTRRL